MSGTRIASVSGLRGIVGDGLDPVVVSEFVAAYLGGCRPGPIVVGTDGRASAHVFQPAAVSSILACGRDVIALGPAATPTVGFSVRSLDAAGGIQISASHNPAEYNGLKFFQPGGMVLGPREGRELLDRLARRDFPWVRWDHLGRVRMSGPGDGRDRGPTEDPFLGHIEAVLKIVNAPEIARRRFKVVLDSCHGSGGGLAADLLSKRLGCELTHLGRQPDGRYDHPPEPTEANLRDLSFTIGKSNADVGFAQDPDADRLAIIDEHGRYIGEELTLALCARHRLGQKTGPVVLNLSTSRTTEDIARGFGCPVDRTAVGEINVVTRMIEVGAVVGGEGNGGIIDPRVGYVRDSFVGMAMVLDLMAATNQPLSVLADELPRWSMVKEKFPLVPGSPPISDLFDRIAEAHPDATADRRDGLRLDWEDCWAHVRSSNTEPIVRVIAEAPDAERAHELANFLGRWIRGEA